MNRHDFFKQRLKTLGMYDKDSDYDGLIGKWVEELSSTWAAQGHSGQSAVITHQLFNKLMIEYGGKDMLPSDPQSSVQDGGEIVKAAKDGAFHTRDKFYAFAQAIEAKDADLEAKIEAVRERIKAIQETRRLDKKERRRMQSKVDQILAEQEKQREKILDRGDEIGALRTRVWELEEKSKPQPKGGVACADEGSARDKVYAWDKDHKAKHELKTGQSVIEDQDEAQSIFHHREGLKEWGYLILDGKIDTEPTWYYVRGTRWLFDLPFPATNPEGKPGGDK